MNFQTELLKIDVGAAPLKTHGSLLPHLPVAQKVFKGLKMQHLFSTWFGKACYCLLMDVNYFIDSEWQQVIQLEIVLTPVENTLQPAARFSDAGLLP